jgi:hypothetical protein
MERKIGMIWLETINTRTAGIMETERALEICRQMYLSIADNKFVEMTIFSNAIYATDISIHLQWRSNPGDKSVLGKELSSALENLGLVSHTVWIEKDHNTGNVNLKELYQSSY